MTVDALVQTVLHRLWVDFYSPNTREFHRDKTALLRCVARFGYECNNRAWFLDADFIAREITMVLNSANRCKADIEYLPAYLDAAITRTIGRRAEELSSAAKSIGAIVKRTENGVKAIPTTTKPNHVATLSALFIQLNRRRPKAAPHREKQQVLF